MAHDRRANIELNFVRSEEGKSRRDKIKSFWEFIDAQKELVPLCPLQDKAGLKNDNSTLSVCGNSEHSQSCKHRDNESSETISDNMDACNLRGQSSSIKSIWYNELRIFKELGLDRVALVASNACKKCLRDEHNNVEKEPEFADSVPESYDELAADLKAFQKRVKDRKPEFAYKDPEKYQHLMK